MPMWKLERQECQPDEMRACIVRAGTAQEARRLASKCAVDEGAEVWLDAKPTTCRLIPQKGTAEVLLTDVFEG